MIPYDDLVAALQNWRLRQGLTVAQTALPVAAPAAAAAAGAPRLQPPAAPRGGPPAPPRSVQNDLDVDDSALLEEANYESEGDDFAMAFNQLEHQDEATAIGAAPGPVGAPRPSELTNPSAAPPPPARRGRW